MDTRLRLIVLGEVNSLLSVMRGGNRWGVNPSLENEHNSLQNGLRGLRDQMVKSTNNNYTDLLDIIKPFCDVVVNEETTGPVTGQAIFSLDKFMASGLFDPELPSTSIGITEVAEAVTHARFVGTNSSDDEVVLMRILRVLTTLLSIPAGQLLTNECVCEIMQSCFRICFEGRLSDILHYFAENTLMEIMRILFSNMDSLKDTPPEEVFNEERKIMDINKSIQHKPFVSSTEEIVVSEAVEDEAKSEQEQPTDRELENEDTSLSLEISEDSGSVDKLVSSRGVRLSAMSSNSDPHGMDCLREVLKFIIAIINPRDRNNSNRLISIGLGLVTVMLECGGISIGRVNSLKQLIQDGLSHHLLLLLSSDSLHLFSQTIRNFFLLIEYSRHILKLQIERFLSVLMDILKNEKQVPAKQELCLECVVQLCHVKGFVPELYINYDCRIHCANILEKLIKHLSKHVVAGNVSTSLQSTNLLALDTVLAVISSLSINEDASQSLPISSSLPSVSDTNTKSSFVCDSAGVIFSSTVANNDEEMQARDDKELSKSEPNLLNVESVHLPSPGTPSDLLKSRQLKKLIVAGTEQFNKKPSGGLVFLMEQGVLQTPLDPTELAQFLHSNPNISKQTLGDFLGSKKNSAVLEAYVKSFSFKGKPLVESLREFLESFRLPGEAPVISIIMERLSKHWMECNVNGYANLFHNSDSVFVLCYAILMLNTDLHSSKLKQKMSLEEFISTRRGMNNGSDFPRQLLTDIYNAIRTNEIVLPSERSGVIREDYEWKVLLRRKDELYYQVTSSTYNQDVFYLCWGSAAAAFSTALDNWPSNSEVYKKIMDGYRLCASIASQYELPEVFDNLIIQLSKFTSLNEPHEQPQMYTVAQILTTDLKARLSVEVLFSLAHSYGNLLREGWKNILDSLGSLYGARLLPEKMVKVKDFMSSTGTSTLYSEEAPTVRPDSSLLSSFFSYNYWLLAGEVSPGSQNTHRSLSPSEVKQRSSTVKWIQECGIELLFSESKFLCQDSLIELIKALVFNSHGPDVHHSLGTSLDEEKAAFYLELLISVTLENRDRVELFLSDITAHLRSIILSEHQCRRLRERAVIAMLQLAIKLMHKEIARPLLTEGLRILLLIPSNVLTSYRVVQRQMACGLVDLVNAMNINTSSSEDWVALFALFELCGTALSFLFKQKPQNSEQQDSPKQKQSVVGVNRFDLLIEESLPPQDSDSFFTVCEALTYVIRNEQCLNERNFTPCLKTVRLLSEVTGTRQALKHDKTLSALPHSVTDKQQTSYAKAALQLLDLLDTLYLSTGVIFKDVGKNHFCEESDDVVSNMWHTCWCPMLEGIARMCCDARYSVRQVAISYLQRALLANNLHGLEKNDWEACFLEVFFPMLSRLMENEGKTDIEETRMRACNLLCKVFLQRLPQLSSLTTFAELWVGILDTMDKYMHIEGSELLPEAIPESLKNMLLVMETQGVLQVGSAPPLQEGESQNSLWLLTWQRLEQFLPSFLLELFPQSRQSVNIPAVVDQPTHRSAQASPTNSDSSPLSESSDDEADNSTSSSFPVVIHPPLPTPSVSPVVSSPPLEQQQQGSEG